MLMAPAEATLRSDERVARIVAAYRRRSGSDALSASLEVLGGQPPCGVAALLEGLEPDWADHAVASVYSALMSKDRRKALGAYFTPPGLVRYLLGRAQEFGVDVASQRIRDPAAGGAAFIVPIARDMVRRWRRDGFTDPMIVNRLGERLAGREVDPELAALANALLRRCLVDEYGFDNSLAGTLNVIREGDTLAVADEMEADHEIGNPPFLRLKASDEPPGSGRFDDIRSGRLNLYSVFVRRGLDSLPPSGVLAYILPASFIGGPEFSRFRRRIRQMADVLAVDMIDGRSSAFMDAVQDTCVLVLRRRAYEVAEVGESVAASNCVGVNGALRSVGAMHLPAGDGPWVLPGIRRNLPSNLAEWGYAPRIGYLVANRQGDRLHEGPAPGRVPLIWAKAIGQDGAFDFQRGMQFREKCWVSVPENAPYVMRTAGVAVQRTSARGQKRRVAAAEIPASFVEEHGGVVAENHVILLSPTSPQAAPAARLAEALNAPQVSEQIDRMCGSASIPAWLLRYVSLPKCPQ